MRQPVQTAAGEPDPPALPRHRERWASPPSESTCPLSGSLPLWQRQQRRPRQSRAPAGEEVRRNVEKSAEGSPDPRAEREIRPGAYRHRGRVLEAQRGDGHPAAEEVPRRWGGLQGPEKHPRQAGCQGHPVEVVSDDFTGPVAIAIGYDDVVAPAKILSSSSRTSRRSRSAARSSRGKRTDAAGVAALARLPGPARAPGEAPGMLNQPAAKLVRTIAEPGPPPRAFDQGRAQTPGSNRT